MSHGERMKEALFAEIRCAKTELSGAKDDLSRLLGETRGALRAEKTTITEALRNALQNLSAARRRLVRLQNLADAQHH
jgi:hypothetical protein